MAAPSFEPCDCTHSIARDSDDEESEGMGNSGQWIAQVHAVCRLAVCSSGNESVAAALAKGDSREEAPSELLGPGIRVASGACGPTRRRS